MTTKPPTEPTSRPVGRDTIRSRLVLEVASEMVDQPSWPHRQARVSLRPQGADEWAVTLIASDGPAAIEQVARGEVQLAISNPAGYLALALRGTGPFCNPNSAPRHHHNPVARPACFRCHRADRFKVFA